MKILGETYYHCRSLGWREGNPETDINFKGVPVKNNQIVIVKLSDCSITTDPETGRKVYNSDDAPQAFPLVYFSTNSGLWKGAIKEVKEGQSILVQSHRSGEKHVAIAGVHYQQRKRFVVKKGKVYGITWNQYINPEDLETFQKQLEVHSKDK